MKAKTNLRRDPKNARRHGERNKASGRIAIKRVIEWCNIRVKLGDLKPWADNPRQISKGQAEKLAESWDEFGQVETIAVGPELEVYNGHQRLNVLLALHGKDYEIDARQSDRALTDAERRKLVVLLHAGATGEWSWDALASWDAPKLTAWGFDSELLGGWKRDVVALGNLLESKSGDNDDDSSPQMSGLEYRIVIDCASEQHQTELLERFAQEGLECRALIS